MEKKCIVIPIYKEFSMLEKSECLSLIQCFKILKNHPIYFVRPGNIDAELYLDISSKYHVIAGIKYFEDDYFKNIAGYNSLLTSKKFYKKFSGYDFMLIYQLDAYVFKDDLDYYTKKKIDYFGAPWFEGFGGPNSNRQFIAGGNGGFSLRNVHTFTRIISRIEMLRFFMSLWKRLRFQKIVQFEHAIFRFKKNLKIHNHSELYKVLLKDKNIHEDYYWSVLVPCVFLDFKVASTIEAIGFSFEVNPKVLFNLNSGQLPFGCHAWEKYEPEFWKPYIG